MGIIVFNGYRVSVWEDGNTLNISIHVDGGDGCIGCEYI